VTQALCFGTVEDRLAVGRALLREQGLVVSMLGLLEGKHGSQAMKAVRQLLLLPGKDESRLALGVVMNHFQACKLLSRKLFRYERPIDHLLTRLRQEEGEQHQQEQEEQQKQTVQLEGSDSSWDSAHEEDAGAIACSVVSEASTCTGRSSPSSGNEAPEVVAQPSTANTQQVIIGHFDYRPCEVPKAVSYRFGLTAEVEGPVASSSSVQMKIEDLLVKARKPRNKTKGSKKSFVGARDVARGGLVR